MRSTEARVYRKPRSEDAGFLPEGPRMMTVSGHPVLVWVNIQTAATSISGTINAPHTEDPLDDFSMPCPGRPGFVLPVLGGDCALVGVDKSLLKCDMDEGDWFPPLATIPDDNPRTLVNDAEVVPGGKAVVFGTKDTQFKDPIAHLYLYTVDDNRVTVLADRQICSNGKVFRTEGDSLVLFDIDTPTRKVVRYKLDVADGTVIVAFYNPDFAAAGKAIRFDLATGAAVEGWTTPGSPRVTCPLLVKRPDGVKLILTTATEGMPAEMRAKCPNAGCLFIADTQFATCPEPELVRLQ